MFYQRSHRTEVRRGVLRFTHNQILQDIFLLIATNLQLLNLNPSLIQETL
jgi:hypothetical protein